MSFVQGYKLFVDKPTGMDRISKKIHQLRPREFVVKYSFAL